MRIDLFFFLLGCCSEIKHTDTNLDRNKKTPLNLPPNCRSLAFRWCCWSVRVIPAVAAAAAASMSCSSCLCCAATTSTAADDEDDDPVTTVLLPLLLALVVVTRSANNSMTARIADRLDVVMVMFIIFAAVFFLVVADVVIDFDIILCVLG